MPTPTDPSGASGGAHLSIDSLPRITTPEEAERYVEEAAVRYETEAFKASHATDPKDQRSLQNRTLMFLGRAVAAAEVAFRMGLLDFSAFRAFHLRVTNKTPPEAMAKRLGRLDTPDSATIYVEQLIRQLKERRAAAVAKAGMSTQALVMAYRLWLTHLGHTLESAGLLTRAGLLTSSAFEAFQEAALSTLIPSVREA